MRNNILYEGLHIEQMAIGYGTLCNVVMIASVALLTDGHIHTTGF